MPRLDRALAEQRLPHLFESWRKPALGAQHDPDFPHVRDVNAVWCRLYDSDVYDQDRSWRIENVAHNQYPFAEGYGVTQEGTYHAFSIHMGLIEASRQKVYTIRHDLPFLAAHIPWAEDEVVSAAFLDTDDKADAYARIRDEAALRVVEWLDAVFRPDEIAPSEPKAELAAV